MFKKIIKELFRIFPLGYIAVIAIIMLGTGVFMPIEYGTHQGGIVLAVGVGIILSICYVLLIIQNKANRSK